jgi:hypothetical protein
MQIFTLFLMRLPCYFTAIPNIDQALETLNLGYESLRITLDEIEEGAEKTDYTGALSDIERSYGEFCEDMIFCREEISDLADNIVKLQLRFSRFGECFNTIIHIPRVKLDKYNVLNERFGEMGERIEKIKK